MSQLFPLIISIYFLSTAQSAPCIPADTCFTGPAGNSNSMFDSSFKLQCSASQPRVTRTTYSGSTTCSSSSSQTETVNSNGDLGRYAGDIVDGVEVQGSSSGTIGTDYLQGANCPLLTSSSSSCSDYMIFKRYGDKGYQVNGESRPYLDIGDGCTGKGTEYDLFVVPIGCVRLDSAGSNKYGCNSTHIWWDHWSGDACTGDYETAQSDAFEVNTCATFEEWTHCGTSGNTICDEGEGVQQKWDYYFDLVCCGDCSDGSGTGTSPGSQPTATPKPTTANPTDIHGTGKPTTPNPTAPTIAGLNDDMGEMRGGIFICVMAMIVSMLNM